MKFLLDENLSRHQAASLRDRGHDAVAVLDVGLSGQTPGVIRLKIHPPTEESIREQIQKSPCDL